MSQALPSGWEWVPLSRLVSKIEAGKSFKCDERPPSGDEPGIVKVSAVTWGRYDEGESKTITDLDRVNPAYLIRPGDFLFSRANTLQLVGACVLVHATTKQLLLSDKILRLVMPEVLKPWVLWFLRSAEGRQQIEALSTGNQESMRNIGQERIGQIEVPLPPGDRLQRIVSRIEELFSEIDEGERALERVGQLVEHYRQSVLKAAVTGELTREWRSSPASASGVTLTVDSASLPPGWSWRSMDELSWATSYGTSAKCLTEPGGIPVLRIPNVRGGRIDLNDLKWAPADLELDAADLLAPGDLLVVRTNGSESLIGVGAVVLEPQPQPSYFASYLIRFRLKPEPFLAEWVNLLWQSDVVRRFVHEHKATSAGQYNISQSKLRALRLPVPPELERKQLLDAWRTVSTRISATLREISTGRTAATALRQSILKAAFSGQLVPQDPRDEPASALLARLAAQAAEAPVAPKRRGRKVPA
jgi:type I restriction enzyme S subunit